MKFMKTYIALFFVLVLSLTLAFPVFASEQTSMSEEYVTDGSDGGEWVKKGDTWVYEMKLPPGVWHYWEKDIDGYTSDAKIGDGKTITQSVREIVVTNTHDQQYGSLTIDKTVVGTVGGDAGPVSEFNFTVTLTGEHIEGIQMFGNYTFYNGVTRLKLANGKSATIDKIPAGTSYTITEEYVPRYSAAINSSNTVSGGTATIINNDDRTATGTIDMDGVDTIHYTNTYTPIPEEEKKTNSFQITKTVSGNTEVKDMNFPLKLSFQGLEPNKTYEIIEKPAGLKLTFNSQSKTESTSYDYLYFYYKDSDGNLRQSSKYGGNNLAGQSVSIPASEFWISFYSNGSFTYYGFAFDTIEPLTTAPSGFTSTVSSLPSYYKIETADNVYPESAHNYSNNARQLWHYQFTQGTTDIADTFTSDRDGDADVTVMIQDGETLIVKDLPVGATYRITEVEGDYVSSYQITDANGGNRIHTSAGSSGEKNIPLSTGKEVVDEEEDITVAFTNEFFKTQELHLTKKVLDTSGAEFFTPEKFRFLIEFNNIPSSGFDSSVGFISAEDGYASVEAQLSGGETIDFTDVPVGTTWQIKELKNNYQSSYGLTVDDETYKDFVKESDENTEPGKDLTTALETVNDGENTTITFVNKRPRISVSKTVTGSMGDKTKDFHFEMRFSGESLSGDPLPESFTYIKGEETGTIPVTDGVLSFTLAHDETITFTDILSGLTYEVVETDGESNGYTVESENASGTLGIDDIAVKFTNRKSGTVPTLAVMNTKVFIPVMIVAMAGAVLFFCRWFKSKRKKKA